jgi:hypothetical protein
MGMRGAALAVILVGATVPAAAAPYSVATDASGDTWVVDDATGAARLCRTVSGSGPKVVDIFGGEGEARASRERPGRVVCVAATRPAGEDAAVPGFAPSPVYAGFGPGGFGGVLIASNLLSAAVAPGMLGDGSSGYQVGSAFGMLGDGTYRLPSGVFAAQPGW